MSSVNITKPGCLERENVMLNNHEFQSLINKLSENSIELLPLFDYRKDLKCNLSVFYFLALALVFVTLFWL